MQKTKASLFSALGETLRGCVFVDLFAGGGAVGIEALGRGADFVHFVERADAAVAALRDNLRACGIDPKRYGIHARDIREVLPEPSPDLARATVIFADPPYDDDVIAFLSQNLDARRFPGLECFALEHASRTLVAAPHGLQLTKTRRFGDTCLSYFSPEEG